MESGIPLWVEADAAPKLAFTKPGGPLYNAGGGQEDVPCLRTLEAARLQI
jgi:hypothetical protein